MYAYLYIIFFTLGLLAICGVITNLRTNKFYSMIYWAITLLFFCMSFLRWERGADWMAYHDFFNSYTEFFSTNSSNFEMGFKTLSVLIKNTIDDYTVFLFIQAAIITFCMGKTMWRYSINPLVSLFVYFALIFANIFFVRQNVAISIAMFSFTFIEKRQFMKFCLCVLFAIQFHITSIIFLIAYPLYKMKFSMKTLIWILLICFLSSIVASRVLLSLFGDMGGFVGAKLSHYLQASEDGGGSMKLPTFASLFAGILSRVFVVSATLLLIGKRRLQSEQLNGIVNFYLFGIVIYCFTAPISIGLVRLVNYYDFFIILLIPHIIYTPKRLLNRFVISIIFYVYLFSRFISLNNQYGTYGDPSPFTPYKSIFNKTEYVDGVY